MKKDIFEKKVSGMWQYLPIIALFAFELSESEKVELIKYYYGDESDTMAG